MALKRDSFSFTLFLGALSALPPLSIDMGLPAIPAIESTFADAAGRGPLTLSLFLAGFALSPLFAGPVADRFGRRRTLLTGLLLFSIAACACAFATTFGALLLYRLLQGVAAGGCVILPLAIVRDVYEGSSARTRLSQITAVVGIAPMAAPILGGWVMTVSDWRWIYAAQGLIGLVLLVVSAMAFEETLPAGKRRELHPAALLHSYRMVLSNRTFVGFALAYALCFACMFSYISGSPSVLMGTLGLSGTMFSLLFALTSAGVMAGSLLSGKLSKRHVASRTIMSRALPAMALCASIGFVLAALGIVHAYTLMPLVAGAIFCFGVLAPSTNHEALHGLPHVAGSASGVLRCIQMFLGAAASALIAWLQPLGHPALIMTGLMTAFSLGALAIYVWTIRGESRAAAEPATHAP